MIEKPVGMVLPLLKIATMQVSSEIWNYVIMEEIANGGTLHQMKDIQH